MSVLRCRSHSSCTSFFLFILLFMKWETEETSHGVQQGNMFSAGNKKEKKFWIEAIEAQILMQFSQRLLCQVLTFSVYKTHLPARTLLWNRNTVCPLRVFHAQADKAGILLVFILWYSTSSVIFPVCFIWLAHSSLLRKCDFIVCVTYRRLYM